MTDRAKLIAEARDVAARLRALTVRRKDGRATAPAAIVRFGAPATLEKVADRLTAALAQIADMQADRPAPLDRVAVARVIDPQSWRNFDYWQDRDMTEEQLNRLVAPSLTKADQIIALCEAAR